MESIARRKEFKSIEKGIYSAMSKKEPDYNKVLNAAQICKKDRYEVYLMPNPNSLTSADVILYKKGRYGLYDVKTISGKSSVSNRLNDSIEQANNVILNITSRYNGRLLANEIMSYFHSYPNANEIILCYKGTVREVINRRKINKGLWKITGNVIR